MGGKGFSLVRYLLLVSALFLFTSCSDKALSLFFDIPPPTPEEEAAEAAAEEQKASELSGLPAQALATPVEEERPVIESVVSWDRAHEMLPRDDLDEVNWVAALHDGTIRPRAAIDGDGDPQAAVFRWDFYFPGPDTSLDAYFPHSSHTEWLECESCHPKVFYYRELEVTMDRIFEGDFCGVCHGVVAFSLDNCTRCHQAMEE